MPPAVLHHQACDRHKADWMPVTKRWQGERGVSLKIGAEAITIRTLSSVDWSTTNVQRVDSR